MAIDFIVRRESATSGGAEGRVDNGEGAIDTPEEAGQALTVFEREVVAADRDQYVIIDSQSRRYTYATIVGMARPAITATVTLPRIEGMRVRVPSVAVPPNISFQNLVAELTLDPGGQQFRVTGDARLNVFTFRALPQGSTGLPPLRLALRVGSQASGEPNSSNLAFTLTSTTQASSIGGSSASGDLVFHVSGVRIGPSVSGEPTGTNGQIVINGNVLDLNGITATGNIPGVEVRVSPQTGALTLVAEAVPPPSTIDSLPDTPAAWFRLDAAFWRDYRQTITSSQRLLNLPGQVADFPNADQLIPRGADDVVFYLNGNSPAGATPNQLTLTGNLSDAASLQALQRDLQGALVIRRLSPNPPPRARDDGEPLRYSEAQNPHGTLYFLSYRNAEGEIRPDGDLDNEMTRLIGAAGPTAVKNGRIDRNALVTALIANPGLSGRMSRNTLEQLIRSYLLAPNGTLRRNGHRGLITVAGLLERDQDRGLGALMEVTNGRRRVAGHEFVDDRFHAGVSGGADGLDLQYRAVLPMTPARAEELLTTLPTHRWDPWVKSSSVDGSTEHVRLLGRDYELTRSRQTVGNIVLLHARLKNPSTDEVYTRTIRLVPITEGGERRTLVLMEEHRDQEGSEQGRPYPRLPIAPDVTPINKDTLLAGALPTIMSLTGPNSDIAALSVDRFAFLMSNLVRLDSDPSLSRADLLASTLYGNDGNRTNTVRIMDYLRLDTSDAANPVLLISDEPRSQDVQNDLRTRLGIDPSVSAPWVVSRANPVAGQSGNVRFIPLRELWQASLAPTGANLGISFDSFRGLTTLLLNPPQEIQGTMSHLTAVTARYWLVLREIQQGLRSGPGNLIPSGGNHPINFFNFDHPSFHSVVSPGNADPGDTVDSSVSFFVPSTNAGLGEQMANVGHHAETFGTFASFNYNPSGTSLIPNARVPNADPTRRYIRAVLIAGADIPYATSTPADIARFDGNVSAAVWQMEDIPGIRRGLYENFGMWLFVPVENAGGQLQGYFGDRYSITNTAVFTDLSPMAQNLARDGLPPFVRALVNEGYRLAGAAAGAPQYAPGRVTGLSDVPQ